MRMKGKLIILVILLLLHFALVLFSVSLSFFFFFFFGWYFFLFLHVFFFSLALHLLVQMVCSNFETDPVILDSGIDHLVNVPHRTDGMDAGMNQENQKVYLSLDGWGDPGIHGRVGRGIGGWRIICAYKMMVILFLFF
ncbi:hypothetical protein EYC84_002080 [Monilinia fructicola]|uniref:Uncharacterized protein n=1 Tax=Monilinia fructicola TaxID=38448 RepID=A0A5M9JVM4_MONFR|nr:hypothetical protein EYC84_002080 [Monilinia fructicola]